MRATEKEILTAKLFFNAAFPVMRVVLKDNPKMAKTWANVKAIVQFVGYDDSGNLACYLDFKDGDVTVVQGMYEGKPDLTLTFNTVSKMVKMFKGSKTALPDFSSLGKGLVTKPKLLLNTILLLLQLMLMMPTVDPTDELKKYIKVKMSLYMITTALSVANKLGWEGISSWTNQPDRIYQFSVGDIHDPEIACYLRVKGGYSKAGRGLYARKAPFAHFHFLSVDGALNVLLKKSNFVGSVEAGDVEIIGSPEYAAQLNDIMAVLQDMLTTL